MENRFLPVCRKDMEDRGWEQGDFVYVIGDAYVDHPSFGHTIISRLLESREDLPDVRSETNIPPIPMS